MLKNMGVHFLRLLLQIEILNALFCICRPTTTDSVCLGAEFYQRERLTLSIG